MEDLDRDRVRPGWADHILRTLEAFGLTWDGDVLWQSRRSEHYRAALQTLHARGLTYRCSCSRREQSAARGRAAAAYPGTCRSGPRRAGPTAVRFRVPDTAVSFSDRLQGPQSAILSCLGDFIIERRDGLAAYQLAVVVDDGLQSVTDVVRGADLLASTPWQISLQRALQLPTPGYAHLPLITEPDGRKLAKSRRSVALDPAKAGSQLVRMLELLRQQPPPQLQRSAVPEILDWAIGAWNPQPLAGIASICAGEEFAPGRKL